MRQILEPKQWGRCELSPIGGCGPQKFLSIFEHLSLCDREKGFYFYGKKKKEKRKWFVFNHLFIQIQTFNLKIRDIFKLKTCA